ncbi:shewanella-like protein phosphatase 1 [Plasmodium gonderi]|uniref:Shewanella-like protein phosphatase 1 n=1 Tax=Plasmodium gonderi TaxID=77519 RepID=A0A1Y1JPP5_PLAGO|nr:shewanella-like protein phosphatase 1 [Plasmodium gonderi]GAW82393.1 shewanella-like protein phosphatase 1 [Plasmodium gonderi]
MNRGRKICTMKLFRVLMYNPGLVLLILIFSSLMYCTEKVSKHNNGKDDFVLKTLAIDKKKLDPSYFYKYDNIEWNGKIIAIGDIHGDIESLKLILRHSNLINENDDWIGENTLLVQVGDILDRGIYGPMIYDYLFKLQKEAIFKNSKIILILGNHEQLNLCGYFDYVNKKEVELFFKNNYNYRLYHFVHKKGKYFQKLIRLPAIAKVNDILFVHAGISKYISLFSLNTIRLKTRLQVENMCNVLPYDKSHNYVTRDGVLWYDYVSRTVPYNHKEACSILSHVFKQYKAKYLVVGHTKQSSHEISYYCNHRFFLIDTGMSLFMNNGQHYPNYLVIQDGVFKAIHLDVEKKNKKKICDSMEIELSNPNKQSFCVQSKETNLSPSLIS